jgi:hypothetical protein
MWSLVPLQAVRIALDVKKHLVDHDRLDITQVGGLGGGGGVQAGGLIMPQQPLPTSFHSRLYCCAPHPVRFPPPIHPQEELEEVLFDLLRQRGYDDAYVRRYQMVTRFFQQKRPLIILIAGSACTGARRCEKGRYGANIHAFTL